MSWDIFLVETKSAVRSRHNKKANSPILRQEGRDEDKSSPVAHLFKLYISEDLALLNVMFIWTLEMNALSLNCLTHPPLMTRMPYFHPPCSGGFVPSALLGNDGCHFLSSPALLQPLVFSFSFSLSLFFSLRGTKPSARWCDQTPFACGKRRQLCFQYAVFSDFFGQSIL